MNRLHLLKHGLRVSRKLLFVELARRSGVFFSTVSFDPSSAGIVVTNNCNSKCVACTQWHQRSSDELSLEEIGELLLQLKRLGIRGITLTGGEPLLRKDLPDIVRKCSALGFEPIAVLTNGLLLRRELAENLLQNGVTGITVSLDGLKETNDRVRGIRGAFEEVVSALEMLSELRDSSYRTTEIRAAMTLMRPTLDQTIPLADVVRHLRVRMLLNLVNATPYLFRVDMTDLRIEDQGELNHVVKELHRLKSSYPDLFTVSHTHASFEYIRKYFQDPRRPDVACILGHIGIHIGAHGDVYSGCLALEPLGNVRERSLKEIVSSPRYRRRLRDMFYKNCPGCSCDYLTNLAYHAPWLWEEIVWTVRLRLSRVVRFLPSGSARPAG